MTRKNKAILFSLCMAMTLALKSCGGEYENEYDFRNELRDTHPYSEIIEIDWGYNWAYQVNDTIKGEVWFYVGGRTKSKVKKHCINCKKE
jgi:hypothetical protein